MLRRDEGLRLYIQISMHEFIRGIAGRLANPGVTVRAQAIFDQAMARGHYRWGRRAKLTAGAALAIALRESHKSDSIRDLAVSIPALSSCCIGRVSAVPGRMSIIWSPVRSIQGVTNPHVRLEVGPLVSPTLTVCWLEIATCWLRIGDTGLETAQL